MEERNGEDESEEKLSFLLQKSRSSQSGGDIFVEDEVCQRLDTVLHFPVNEGQPQICDAPEQIGKAPSQDVHEVRQEAHKRGRAMHDKNERGGHHIPGRCHLPRLPDVIVCKIMCILADDLPNTIDQLVAMNDVTGVCHDEDLHQLVTNGFTARKVCTLDEVLGASFSPDGTRLGVISHKEISIVDCKSGTYLHRFPHRNLLSSEDERFGQRQSNLSFICFSCDGNRMLSQEDRTSICIRNTYTGECLGVVDESTTGALDFEKVLLSPNASWLVIKQRSEVFICDATTGDLLHRVDILKDISSIRISGNSARIAISHRDPSTVSIWNLETGEHIQKMQLSYSPTHLYNSAFLRALNHDGSKIITMSKSMYEGVDIYEFYVWNVATGECISRKEVKSPSDMISEPFFSCDGTFYVMAFAITYFERSHSYANRPNMSLWNMDTDDMRFLTIDMAPGSSPKFLEFYDQIAWLTPEMRLAIYDLHDCMLKENFSRNGEDHKMTERNPPNEAELIFRVGRYGVLLPQTANRIAWSRKSPASTYYDRQMTLDVWNCPCLRFKADYPDYVTTMSKHAIKFPNILQSLQ